VPQSRSVPTSEPLTATLPSLRAVKAAPSAVRAELLVVPVRDGAVAEAVKPLGRALAAALVKRARESDLRGRTDELLLHPREGGMVALLGIGSGGNGGDVWRRAGARARREAERIGARRVAVWTGGDAEDHGILGAIAEGFLLAGYRFDGYRSETRPPRVEALILASDRLAKPNATRPVLDGVASVSAAVFAARDLVNEPPSVGTPRFLAEHARRLAASSPTLTAEIWDTKRIAKEGLVGLQAVARGSAEEPRFVTLRHAGRGATKRIALVGKGVTFDSGGLSLKPAKSMETMKYDMAGGAAVLSAVAAAAALELPVDVTAYVPATENLPGGRAQKPGDVIRYANGRTVEVLNTDAEGRLVLADALLVAGRDRPDAIVDLATLTGAARIALGSLYACLLANDQALADALLAAGRTSGEPCWQLPLVREYRDDLKSPVADLKNVGGGDAGTIIGALFLAEFVGTTPWAHLDIAGPAFADRELPLASRGATGYGVRLLVDYLRGAAAS
jgi:leucyl aminopeptidase